jgi:hypothetical protein
MGSIAAVGAIALAVAMGLFFGRRDKRMSRL